VRKESIKELLDEVKETFEIISTHKKISKPKVKSIFEHLRSSLEYAAQDINSNMPKVKEKIYFPYASNEIEFEKSIKRNLPELALYFPEVYLEVKSIQSFECGNDWLVVMCNLTNDTKHNNAIDIHRDDEVKAVSISADGLNLAFLGGNCSNIKFINNRINGKLMDDFTYDQGEVIITKKGDVSVNYKITKDRKIIVGNDQIDLLPFLDDCIVNTEQFINRLYELL
jgi:hypothetical protein